MPARTPDGPPPPPVVQRLRLRYAKRGRLRFTSHRDIARAFERAVRRAGVPVAFSAGFSPHPKISWLGAAPTGVASEAEYLEIGVAVECDPDAVALALDASLPPGLDVLECVEATPGGGGLAERIDAARWRLRLPGVDADELGAAVEAFLRAERVEVERRTKDGRRMVDARGAVVSAAVGPDPSAAGTGTLTAGDVAGAAACPAVGDGPCAILEVVARLTTPAVRPDDILAALRAVAGLAPAAPATATRLAQGRLGADGSLDDPLGPDRAAGRQRQTLSVGG